MMLDLALLVAVGRKAEGPPDAHGRRESALRGRKDVLVDVHEVHVRKRDSARFPETQDLETAQRRPEKRDGSGRGHFAEQVEIPLTLFEVHVPEKRSGQLLQAGDERLGIGMEEIMPTGRTMLVNVIEDADQLFREIADGRDRAQRRDQRRVDVPEMVDKRRRNRSALHAPGEVGDRFADGGLGFDFRERPKCPPFLFGQRLLDGVEQNAGQVGPELGPGKKEVFRVRMKDEPHIIRRVNPPVRVAGLDEFQEPLEEGENRRPRQGIAERDIELLLRKIGQGLLVKREERLRRGQDDHLPLVKARRVVKLFPQDGVQRENLAVRIRAIRERNLRTRSHRISVPDSTAGPIPSFARTSSIPSAR